MIGHNMNAPLGPSSRAVAKEGTKGAPIGMEGRGAHSCAHSKGGHEGGIVMEGRGGEGGAQLRALRAEHSAGVLDDEAHALARVARRRVLERGVA